uniref:Uncharacterized protein n=1 Tax=Vitrella brassicaformis TaxID=1169539 RepID=A0A7S1JTG5_9ALVE|mmetsp:Transcript_23948/g.59200  ORF Transcript_23948/g.59200 Transcript_23948/m.59200 type:complete len:398 (+) Transcript_23948:1392-2585(+)
MAEKRAGHAENAAILKIDSGESRARLAELVVDALKNVQDYLANLDEKKTKAAAKELFRKAMRPARDCILNLDPEFVVKKFLSIIDRANTRLQQLAATIDSKDLGHLNQMPVQLTLKARGKIEEAWQTSGEETLHHSLESLICLGIELARELLRAFDSEQRMCDRDEIKPVCGALVAKGLEVVREVAKQMNVPQEDLTEIVEYASTMPDMVAAWLPDVELWDADEADTKLKDVTEGLADIESWLLPHEDHEEMTARLGFPSSWLDMGVKSLAEQMDDIEGKKADARDLLDSRVRQMTSFAQTADIDKISEKVGDFVVEIVRQCQSLLHKIDWGEISETARRLAECASELIKTPLLAYVIGVILFYPGWRSWLQTEGPRLILNCSAMLCLAAFVLDLYR